jgi:hypothetical protein
VCWRHSAAFVSSGIISLQCRALSSASGDLSEPAGAHFQPGDLHADGHSLRAVAGTARLQSQPAAVDTDFGSQRLVGRRGL